MTDDARSAFNQHIDEAGITTRIAKKLGWKIVADASSLDPNFLELAAFVIPYFKPNGEPLRNFVRIRYLEEPPTAGGFGKKKEGAKKPPRYTQLTGTPMEVYLPPLGEWAWDEIFADPEVPIFITEGEKKAVAATANGFHCIGLGGVWSFRDPLTKEFLKTLRAVAWEGRDVFIVYDSDLIAKKEVRSALVELSKMLSIAGAFPRVVRLPAEDGEKNGLDDYLYSYGVKSFERLVDAAEDIVQSAELERYNELFCVIQFPPEIRSMLDHEKTWSLASPQAFVAAHNMDLMRVFDGKGQPKMTPVAKHWLEWPHRNTAARIAFEPEKPFPLCWVSNESRYNLWRGWGVESKRGPTEIWQQLLAGVFSGRMDLVRWFEQWLSYPIQNPGAKLYQAVYIWGTGQGTGKSSIGKFMLRIYGPHGRELSDDAFTNGFNAWIENTSFVLADDLANEHPKTIKSTLKRLIASDDIEVHRKYRDSYRADNHCQFLFTAQTNTAIPMDENENRRYFIVRAPDMKPYEEAWYTHEMDAYLRGDGPSFVRYRLEHLSLEGFRPHGDAPTTPDGEETVAASAPEVGLWLMKLRKDPDGWLTERGLPLDLDILTGEQLITWAKQDIEHVRAKMVLRDAAKVLLRVGQSGPFPDRSRPVLYAFRNTSKYKGQVSKARAHFLKRFPPRQ